MSNWAYSLESSIALHKNKRLYFSIPDSLNEPKILYWRSICSPRTQQCCLGNPQGILRCRTIFSSGQRRGILLELNISNKTYRVYVAIRISVSSGSLVTEGWRQTLCIHIRFNCGGKHLLSSSPGGKIGACSRGSQGAMLIKHVM